MTVKDGRGLGRILAGSYEGGVPRCAKSWEPQSAKSVLLITDRGRVVSWKGERETPASREPG